MAKAPQDHTTVNRTTVCVCVCVFFLRSRNRTMATGIWPRCLKANSRGKIPVAIPRFLLCWKRNLRHSIRCGLVIFMVLLSLFIPHFGNLVTVDSPRLPKSSGTDPKKALRYFLPRAIFLAESSKWNFSWNELSELLSWGFQRIRSLIGIGAHFKLFRKKWIKICATKRCKYFGISRPTRGKYRDFSCILTLLSTPAPL